ncbi:MAG: class I SAM-dependent methyltransferase [Gaiellaceae bacterium]
MSQKDTSYSADYYRILADESRRSADRVLPVLLESSTVLSALDVGCGLGTWLAALQDLGVKDVVGIDGDYIQRELLQFPSERFMPLNLEESFDLGRRFDLVISMEVAEHLAPASAEAFVGSLVRHAPTILFSAAIPRQGGTDHVNEQWPDYWAEKFRRHGYLAVDAIRPRIWGDPAVAFWYAQNTILYVRPDHLPESLRSRVVEDLTSLSVVHPRQFSAATEPPAPHGRRRSIGETAVGALRAPFVVSLRRRLGLLDLRTRWFGGRFARS